MVNLNEIGSAKYSVKEIFESYLDTTDSDIVSVLYDDYPVHLDAWANDNGMYTYELIDSITYHLDDTANVRIIDQDEESMITELNINVVFIYMNWKI